LVEVLVLLVAVVVVVVVAIHKRPAPLLESL
jgi:hypothetical protein